MHRFTDTIQLRWTDIDANRHVKHSSYNDFGAILRMNFFVTHGLTTEIMERAQIGIVLFREETVFRRELKYEDKVTLDVEITKATPDYARWSLRHHIYKNDETLAATLNLDGAWIDMKLRKLATPDEFIQSVFDKLPRAKEFVTVLPAKP